MEIRISDLRLLADMLFKHLEEKRIETIEITSDFYWDISPELRYDPYKEPGDHVVGQLTDDWQELRRIIEGDNEPISYALVWFSSILRVIGEKVVQ